MPLTAYAVSKKEIWHVAGEMLGAHPAMAAIEVSNTADACIEQGDLDSQYFWKRVKRSVVAMTDSHGEGAHQAFL
ncbi:MAG: hypothetical protein AB1631_26680 [Acidobacteriota bacterium]